MASEKITAMPDWAGGQVPTDLVTGVDLSQPDATKNVKSTLNDLLHIITKNLTDGALRYQGTFAPAVSAANQGSFYYNDTTDTFQGSRNGSAYEDLIFGAGTSHQVTYWGTLQDEVLGNAGFQYFPAASPEVRIVQLSTSHIALNVTSTDNIDSTFPLAKFVSADGLCEVTITPGSTAFATDTLAQVLIRNTSAAAGGRVATLAVQDTVTANLPFIEVLNNFGSELLMGVNGTTTAGTNTGNVANSCLLQSCCPEGMFYVADDGGREHQYFVTGGFAFSNIRFVLDTEGNVVIGSAALATTATNGFFYINACAGVPTGVPNPLITVPFWNRTGRIPLVVDSTNQKLYGNFAGSWVSLTGGAGSGTVNAGTQFQLAYYPASSAAVSGNTGILTDANNHLNITPGNDTRNTLRVNHTDSTPKVQLGGYPDAGGYAGIWLANLTPDGTNYVLISNGSSDTVLNSPASNGAVRIRAAHGSSPTITTHAQDGVSMFANATGSAGLDLFAPATNIPGLRVTTGQDPSAPIARFRINRGGTTGDAYTFDATATAGELTESAPNGATSVIGVLMESVSLSTSGATTDSTIDLPANSIILGVTARITTTIAGVDSTALQIGDPTTATRFNSTASALTAGTTIVGLNQMQGGIVTDATGPVQIATAKVRLTLAGGIDNTPSAGIVRITIHYIKLTAPIN